MSGFLTCLIGGALLAGVLLGVDRVGRWRDARWARREAARRAFARHPAQGALRRVPGLPVDGEPLDDWELAEYTAIMMTPPTGSDEARETSADEGAE